MTKRLFIVFFGFSLFFTNYLFSQQNKIEEMIQNPQRFNNEVVSLEGFVTQYVEGNAQTTSFYYLKDDWGGIIKVRTTQSKPEVGKRYKVRGTATIDPVINEIFIHEDTRTSVEQPQKTEAEGGGGNILIYLLVGAILIIFLIIIILLLTVFRKKAPIESIAGKKVLEEAKVPEPEEMLEGKTVKMAVPPPGTLKLLPGRFIVLSGEDRIKEIRFYKTKAQEENEITFGRASGKAYNHIQVKSMTVSAKQAKLLYAGNKFTLINYSNTNRTKVNDVELEENGSAELKEGDRIEMGEVLFEFRPQ